MNIEDITFDQDDRNLFQIDDLRLKADALRYSILPKLQEMVNQATLGIKNVYDVEVLDDSHIAQSPNFRTTRNNHLKVDYTWAKVGISGKWGKNRWFGFNKKNGKPVQILPFSYDFCLFEQGLSIHFMNHWVTGLSNDSYIKLLQFHLDFESIIHTLCYTTDMAPDLYYGPGCEPISTFAEHYRWMIDNQVFANDFNTRHFDYPISNQQINELIDNFVLFYPVYDSYIQIASGKEVRFDALLQRLNARIKESTEGSREATVDDTIDADSNQQMLAGHDLLKAKEMAAERVKVMPAMRWQVFQRDNWRCVACGRSAADGVVLHIDHIVPRSKGGENTLDNYQTLCNVCNIGKGNRDDTDLRRRENEV